MAEYASLLVRIVYEKSKSKARPIPLFCPYNPVLPAGSDPDNVLRRYQESRPGGRGFFSVQAQYELGTANLGSWLKDILTGLGLNTPDGYYYNSHSSLTVLLNAL